MHSDPSPRSPTLVPKPQHSRGFSLIEVALALGIVGFAFVGLMGLLPIGLSTFRVAIDQTNEGRIMETLSTKTQAAEFASVPAQFDFQQSQNVFYFDEEGTFIKQGTTGYGGLNATEKLAALYSVKVFVSAGWNGNVDSTNSNTAVVLMTGTGSGGATQFENELKTSNDVQRLLAQGKLHPGIRVRTLVIPKMDGEPIK